MSDEIYMFISEASDGTVHRALLRASVALLVWRGHVKAFEVSPNVWMQLMHETSYATIPGTRWKDDKPQLCTPGGYCDVIAAPQLDPHTARCEVGNARATLDLEAVCT